VTAALEAGAAAAVGAASSLPRLFQGYSFTGPLRPAYPLSATRLLPTPLSPALERSIPDYASDGVPLDEIENRAHLVNLTHPKEVQGMRRAGALSGAVLEAVIDAAKEGVTTDELDALAHDMIVGAGAYPAPLNYRGFPKSICTSLNEVICHGIPDQRPLQSGDILNIDVSLNWEGYHGDTNAMVPIGKVSDEATRLIEAARQALIAPMKVCRPGMMYRECGKYIGKAVERTGFSIVKSFCGHGCNKLFHPAPSIPHYPRNKCVGVMEVGHCFTLEPMINAGTWHDVMWPDDWTAVTRDGRLSAQFEHTMIVTKKGVEILTVSERDFVFGKGEVISEEARKNGMGTVTYNQLGKWEPGKWDADNDSSVYITKAGKK
jgi:methionyl aminopeptidase